MRAETVIVDPNGAEHVTWTRAEFHATLVELRLKFGDDAEFEVLTRFSDEGYVEQLGPARSSEHRNVQNRHWQRLRR